MVEWIQFNYIFVTWGKNRTSSNILGLLGKYLMIYRGLKEAICKTAQIANAWGGGSQDQPCLEKFQDILVKFRIFLSKTCPYLVTKIIKIWDGQVRGIGWVDM